MITKSFSTCIFECLNVLDPVLDVGVKQFINLYNVCPLIELHSLHSSGREKNIYIIYIKNTYIIKYAHNHVLFYIGICINKYSYLVILIDISMLKGNKVNLYHYFIFLPNKK